MSMRTARISTGRTNRAGQQESNNRLGTSGSRSIPQASLQSTQLTSRQPTSRPLTARQDTSHNFNHDTNKSHSRSGSYQYTRPPSSGQVSGSLTSRESSHSRSRSFGSSRKNPIFNDKFNENSRRKSNRWQHSLPTDYNPWDVGLDTQRIAHELEWDDQQLDEADMTPMKLARAKAFAANHFVHRELHPNTIEATPEFQGLDREGMVNLMSQSKAFGKQLRQLKYMNRRLTNKSSAAVVECMAGEDHDPQNQGDLFPVNTKPYSTGIVSQSSTGVKSLRELKYKRSLENVKVGQSWLARDETYLKPGVNFRRVNAFMRDAYVSR